MRVAAPTSVHRRHPLDAVYRGMRDRCEKPSHISYMYYGALGVYVCEEWRESFKQFCADVGPRPSASHTLDRYPDPTGPYHPSNVRWATPEQQQANKRPRRRKQLACVRPPGWRKQLISFGGITLTREEWAISLSADLSKYEVVA